MTRLEKLRSMSAEELAEALYPTSFDAFCNAKYCAKCDGKTCVLFEDPEHEAEPAEVERACKAACVRYLNAEV